MLSSHYRCSRAASRWRVCLQSKLESMNVGNFLTRFLSRPARKRRSHWARTTSIRSRASVMALASAPRLLMATESAIQAATHGYELRWGLSLTLISRVTALTYIGMMFTASFTARSKPSEFERDARKQLGSPLFSLWQLVRSSVVGSLEEMI